MRRWVFSGGLLASALLWPSPLLASDDSAALARAFSGLWWVLASVGVFAFVQLLKGKLAPLPGVTAFLEGMSPRVRFGFIVAGTVVAHILAAVPEGATAMFVAGVTGVQVAAGAVMAHLSWKLVGKPE
jgi:hypothetical protein